MRGKRGLWQFNYKHMYQQHQNGLFASIEGFKYQVLRLISKVTLHYQGQRAEG